MENAAVLESQFQPIAVDVRTNERVTENNLKELAQQRYQQLTRSHSWLSKREKIIHDKSRPIRNASLKEKLTGIFVITPLFLFGSVIVILFLPERVIKKITAPFSGIKFWEKFGKRIFDFMMAILGFCLCSILFLFVPILIKLDSPGTTFYQQVRVGMNYRRRDRRKVSIQVKNDRRKGERRKQDLHGRPFRVYKFRTMTQDAEKKSGAVWAQKNDPRITRVGNILRFTHVDEIPQFLNVLHGDMSMVGPRPERPQIIPGLKQKIENYTRRLEVKPGMTGIAQIYCGYDETIEDVREKVRYDLLYTNRHSLKSDLLILFQTLWMIIRGREAADE